MPASLKRPTSSESFESSAFHGKQRKLSTCTSETDLSSSTEVTVLSSGACDVGEATQMPNIAIPTANTNTETIKQELIKVALDKSISTADCMAAMTAIFNRTPSSVTKALLQRPPSSARRQSRGKGKEKKPFTLPYEVISAPDIPANLDSGTDLSSPFVSDGLYPWYPLRWSPSLSRWVTSISDDPMNDGSSIIEGGYAVPPGIANVPRRTEWKLRKELKDKAKKIREIQKRARDTAERRTLRVGEGVWRNRLKTTIIERSLENDTFAVHKKMEGNMRKTALEGTEDPGSPSDKKCKRTGLNQEGYWAPPVKGSKRVRKPPQRYL